MNKGNTAIYEKTLSTGFNNKGATNTMSTTAGLDQTTKIPDMTVNEKLANEATLRGEIHVMEVSSCLNRKESRRWLSKSSRTRERRSS